MLKCECDGQAKWTILFLVGHYSAIYVYSKYRQRTRKGSINDFVYQWEVHCTLQPQGILIASMKQALHQDSE